MERLRSLFYWMVAVDPALTWDVRLGRWASVATVVSVVVTAGVWAIGWLFSIPWWVGLMAGLVAWVVILNGFVALGRRATPATETTTPTTAQAKDDPSPSPSPADPQEVEQRWTSLAEARQEIDRLQEELGKRPARHLGESEAVDIGAIAANGESKREIEELKAEAEQLRTTLHDVEHERDELKAKFEVLAKELAVAQTRPHPEPSRSVADEPFSLEPVKRRGPLKSNGEFDIYASIQVTNKGSDRIRGCRGRLVRVQELVSTPDGSEWRDIPHIHSALLRWSPGDGGDSADFTTEATLDVVVIESWAEPVYQLLTANESLRSTYQLEYGQAGPILTVEISAQSGDPVVRTFSLDGHLRDFLEAPLEVEPVVRWRLWAQLVA